jgi:hypothetical protein
MCLLLPLLLVAGVGLGVTELFCVLGRVEASTQQQQLAAGMMGVAATRPKNRG